VVAGQGADGKPWRPHRGLHVFARKTNLLLNDTFAHGQHGGRIAPRLGPDAEVDEAVRRSERYALVGHEETGAGRKSDVGPDEVGARTPTLLADMIDRDQAPPELRVMDVDVRPRRLVEDPVRSAHRPGRPGMVVEPEALLVQ